MELFGVDFWDRVLEQSAILLVLVIFTTGTFRGVRSVWEFLKPHISRWFGKQIMLIETLIDRNLSQEVSDGLVKQMSNQHLSRSQACEIAEHACNVLSHVCHDLKINGAEEPLGRLRQAIDDVRQEGSA